MPNTWPTKYLGLAVFISKFSKDPSTKVGCVITGIDNEIKSIGYNGFPRGCSDDLEIYLDRTRKHLRTCHAEANAIASAAKSGTSLNNCTAYISYPPCAQCAALMIQAGITKIHWLNNQLRKDWRINTVEALKLFAESHIVYNVWEKSKEIEE
jgi:dCMP deaminase